MKTMLQCWVDVELALRLDECIKKGYFSNKTNAIKEAVSNLIELAEEQKKLIV